MKALHVAAVLLVALLAPARAHAITHFLNANTRPAPVTIWEGATKVTAVYALVGHGEANNSLAWKKSDSDWQVIPYPSGVTSMYEVPGLSAVSFPETQGRQPEIYMMSVANSGGLSQSKLWRYVHGGGSSGWTQVGSFVRISGQTGTPAMAAGRRLSSGEVWIAVRPFGSTAGGTAMWACKSGSAPACTVVTCDTSTSACVNPRIDSPVGIDFGTLGGAASEELFAVDTAGRLEHYRFVESSGQVALESLGIPAGTTSVMSTAISVWPGDGSNGTIELLVAGQSSSPAYTMQLASLKLGAPDSWSWLHVLVPSSGSNDVGVDPGVGNLFEDRDPSGTRRLWAFDGRANLQGCLLASLSNTGSQNCYPGTPPSLPANPSDMRPNVDRIGPAFAVRGETLWVTGSLGYGAINPEYLYSRALTAGGSGPVGQWRNHLSLRDRTSTLPGGIKVAEFPAAEWYGTIVVAGIERSTAAGANVPFVRVWRSTDDGNTWAVSAPFGDGTATRKSSDPGVGISPDGTAYVSIVRPHLTDGTTGWVEVTRWDGTAGTWASPVEVPGTRNAIDDRPWLYADPIDAGGLYLSFTGVEQPPSTGWLSYCREAPGVSCATGTPNGWCPLTALNSSTSCNGNLRGSTGCPVVRTSDGAVWVAVQDDSACTDVDRRVDPGRRAFGLRQVLRNGNGCPSGLSTPECVYFGALNSYWGGDDFRDASAVEVPRNWVLDIATAVDGSNRMAISLRSYRDLGGTRCTSTSSACRSDIYVATRAAGQWCGTSCTPNGTDDTHMLRLGANELPPLDANSYSLGSVSLLDYAEMAATWLHARGTQGAASADFMASHLLAGGSALSLQGADLAIASSSNVAEFSPQMDNDSWLGDFQQHASARLHTHFFGPQSTSPTSTTPVTTAWSPAASSP